MSDRAIEWLGHATVRLDLADQVLLTDPVLRDRIGPLRRRGPSVRQGALDGVTAVLLSHLHHDHLDVPSLRRLPPDVPVLVPRGGARPVRGAGLHDVVEVVPGDVVRLGSFDVHVVPARHPGGRAGTSLRAPAVGHLVVPHGGQRGLYVAGDTGRQPEVEESLRGRVATAVLPVAGWGPTLGAEHLDPAQAADVAAVLEPDLALPYHWGTLLAPGTRLVRPGLTVRAGAAFVSHLQQHAPEVGAAVMRVGRSLELPSW